MSDFILQAEPLTAEAFSPYGDVLEATAIKSELFNDARFARHDDLALVDIDSSNGGHVAISIATSQVATSFPHTIDLVERHPLGSQAFIPLQEFVFTVVVAPAGDTVDSSDLHAFKTNGSQGINYHRGVWHMPLIATAAGQKFLIVDRAPGADNCELLTLQQKVMLQA